MDMWSSLDKKSVTNNITLVSSKKKIDDPKLKKLQYHAVKRKSGWTDKSMLHHILVKTFMIFTLNLVLLATLLSRGSDQYEFTIAISVGQ